ncbi:MAG: hypothetical protein Kow0020_10020 [Wenzhouxiangellaceae bacterium]
MNAVEHTLTLLQTVPRIDPDLDPLLVNDEALPAMSGLPTFELFAQPIYATRPGNRHHWVELLIRGTAHWSQLPVDRLVDVAYRNCGVDFDLAVVREGCRIARRWTGCTRLSVNIHPRSLHQPRFVSTLANWAERHPGIARRLVLELVEFQGAVDLSHCHNALVQLHRSGYRLALDDFGPGAPNFDVLSTGLIGTVKLDRSLVRHLECKPASERLIAGLVAFASRLGVDLVAEGIETRAQFERLSALGIEWFQGYLLGRPRPVQQYPTPPFTPTQKEQQS